MLLSRSDSSPESVPPSHGPKSPDEATKLNVEAMQPIEAQSSQRTSPRPVIVPLSSSARRTSHLTAQEQAAQDGVVASNESSTSSRARHPRKSARELIRGILSSADVSASSNFKLIKHSLLAARALGGKAWNPGSVASGHKQYASGLNKLKTAIEEVKKNGIPRKVLPSRMFRTLLHAVTFETMWRQGQAEQDKGREKWDSDKEAAEEMQDDQWYSLQLSIAKAIRSRVDKIARMEADLRSGLAPAEAVRAEMQRKQEERMERIYRRKTSRMAIVDHLHRGVFEPQSSIAAQATSKAGIGAQDAVDGDQYQEMRALNGLARAENTSPDNTHGSYQAYWEAQDARAAAAALGRLHHDHDGASTTGSRASAPFSPPGGSNAADDTTMTKSTDTVQRESKRRESPQLADLGAGQQQPRPARHARRRRSSIVGAVLALPRGRTSPPLLSSVGSANNSSAAADCGSAGVRAGVAGSAKSGAATGNESGEHLLAYSQASSDAKPPWYWQGGAGISVRAGASCDSDSAHRQSSPRRAPDTVSGFRSSSPQRDAAALLARVVAKEARVSLKGVRAQVPIGTFIRMSRAKEKLVAPSCVAAEPPRILQVGSQAVSHQPFAYPARQTEGQGPMHAKGSSKARGGGAMRSIKTGKREPDAGGLASAARRRPADRTRASVPSAGKSASSARAAPMIASGHRHTSVSRPAQHNRSRPKHRSPKPLGMRRYGPAGSSPGIEYPLPHRTPTTDHQRRHEGGIRDYTAAGGQPTLHASSHTGAVVHSPIATLVKQARSATTGVLQRRGGTGSLRKHASGTRWTPEQQQRSGVLSRAASEVRPGQATAMAPSPLRLRRRHRYQGASLSRLREAPGATYKAGQYPYAATLGAAKPKPRRLVPLKLRSKKGP